MRAGKDLDYHLEALTSALVEFQKSQCFFAATLQIAAVIVIPGILGGVQTRDQVLIYLTAANSFSPIMLTLAQIKFLGGRSSWYLLTLSGITFVLGTATYWNSSPTLSGSSANAMFYTNPATPIMSCGNLAPYAPCYVQNEFFLAELWPAIGGVFYRLPEKTGLAVWITSLIMLLYQTVSKLLDIRRNRQRVERHLRDCRDLLEAICDIAITKIKTYKLGKQLSLRTTQLSNQLRVPFILASTLKTIRQESLWDHVQIGLGTIALVVQLVTVIEVLVRSSNIISTQMTFGQIVAVGIWIPVLLEYGYLEICKHSSISKRK